jgi:hypothetical protein
MPKLLVTYGIHGILLLCILLMNNSCCSRLTPPFLMGVANPICPFGAIVASAISKGTLKQMEGIAGEMDKRQIVYHLTPSHFKEFYVMDALKVVR